MTCECERIIRTKEAEKLDLEIESLQLRNEDDRFLRYQRFGNTLFKGVIAFTAIATLMLKAFESGIVIDANKKSAKHNIEVSSND